MDKLKWLITNAYPHRLYCPHCYRTNVYNIEILDNKCPRYCMWCGKENGTPKELQKFYYVKLGEE